MSDYTGKRIGQYTILGRLGEGGMGQVYLARQESMDREVAIKFIVDRAANVAEFAERFEREVKICASLNHAHIIKVFDYGKSLQQAAGYLVMEYLKGGSLADLIRKKHPLPLDAIAKLLEQIASALDYAHSKGIIHRDLKPLNVLLDEGSNAYISDFELAKLRSASTLTQTGMALGTAYYMAPELWRGKPPADHRVDIYALGVMIFEMLTGQLPFNGDSSATLMYMHLESRVPLARDYRSGVSDITQSVIKKAMAKDPHDRFGRASEILSISRKGSDNGRTRPSGRSAPKGSQMHPSETQGALLEQNGARTYLDRAFSNYENGQYDEALAAWTRAIQFDPANATAYYNRGLTYGRLHRYDQAIADYNRAIQLDPAHANAYFSRGLMHRILARYEDALADFTFAIELDPANPDAYCFRGRSFAALGREDDALADFTRTIQLNPSSADAYVSRGMSYSNLGKLEEALIDLTHAIKLDTADAGAYLLRGISYAQLGRYEEALCDFSKSIILDPTNPYAHFCRGQSYAALDMYEAAIAEFTRGIGLEPADKHAFHSRGQCYDALGRHEEALADYTRAMDSIASMGDSLRRFKLR